ncbi:thiamine pyrophosphate-dependent acetolactate synthase large subunit-like protein [Bosea sp. AK1]|uniref:thiamine pyrophosphate-binding protein n=1 Tax=Bosea sp. AK1 TaxID=2587160 RepID=UPI001153A0C7|nr:thiamine pyrophosphate-dependent enzyme [Bosea sp. AK1]TQI65335.1 thiamine pyrophosphate-dependent acetolactate synthase large subunit-like protein [Bosea sp. AK1]
MPIDESASALERPVGISQTPPAFGSDVIASVLRDLDIPFVALNPGASFRGLHDSLVNFLGNERPQMLLCLHEEHAVAIAHGWAKITGRPMAAIVHSNVGLMHGSMAIFNAWCDRAPMLVLGATGPVDAAKRRPWIDWIHTARDQGALVRHFVKWDDQPGSVEAAVESLLRAHLLATTAPFGPTYLCFDAEIQEAPLEKVVPPPSIHRFVAPRPGEPNREDLAAAAKALGAARRPLILAGRVSRSESGWQTRIELAEHLGALVLTDLKIPASFPTTHPLHGAPAGMFPTPAGQALIREADVILSLDWVDLAGTLRAAFDCNAAQPLVIQASVDQLVHNGWSMDHQGLPPADITLLTEPDVAATALLQALSSSPSGAATWPDRSPVSLPDLPSPATASSINVPLLATTLRSALDGAETSLIRTPLSWAGHLWPLNHPLDLLGYDGGGGIGSGLGMAIGGALALRGTDRLPVAVIGDGDFMMGASALWTAVHYRIPLLVVVANNQSFFNDEVHQERVARMRHRPVENRWIGQRMIDPAIDLAGVARAQGATAFGPVEKPMDLEPTFREAIAAVRRGEVAVVDVRVDTGYDPSMTSALTRATK